ncbi:MAG: hypothetical protein ACKOXB_09560 [Flavobacteriales bacterium]
MESKMDDLFKSGLNHLPEEFPSEQDWSALKKELNSAGLIKKDKKKFRFFIWIFSAALLSGLSALAIFYGSKDGETTELKTVADEREEVVMNTSGTEKESAQQSQELTSSKTSSPKEEKSLKKETEKKIKTALPKGKFVAKLNGANTSAVSAKPNYAAAAVSGNSSKTETENPSLQLEEISEEKQEDVAVIGTASKMGDSESLPMQADIENQADADSLVSILSADTSTTFAKLDTPALGTERKEEVVDASIYRKLWGGLQLSLDYNNYTLKEGNQLAGELLKNGHLKGNGLLQYSAGLSFGYRHSKWLGISADLMYSQKRKVDEYVMEPASIDVESNTNLYHYKFEAKYLDVVIKPRLYIWHKKFSAYVFPGFVTSFNLPGIQGKSYFTSSKVTKDGYLQEKINLEFFSMGFALLGGVGFEYDLKNNFKMAGEFSCRQNLTPVIQHATYKGIPVMHYLHSVNATVGVHKYF